MSEKFSTNNFESSEKLEMKEIPEGWTDIINLIQKTNVSRTTIQNIVLKSFHQSNHGTIKIVQILLRLVSINLYLTLF